MNTGDDAMAGRKGAARGTAGRKTVAAGAQAVARPAADGPVGSARLAAIDRLVAALPGIAALDGAAREEATAEALALVEAFEPRDGAEGLLAGQMVAAHLAAMDCLSRAHRPENRAGGDGVDGITATGGAAAGRAGEGVRAGYLRQAQRFLTLYMQQLQTLDRRRGGLRQRMTVEHIDVRFVPPEGGEEGRNGDDAP